ncbi:MAG TPA: hypothetical protein DDY70_07085 [Clostridiales bacterium]|nr:hypothetical protein [Clostridiales bacterium]
MKVTFCVHGDTICDQALFDKLSACVTGLIEAGATQFYLGGYGNFDLLAAKVVQNIKERNPEIRSVLVIPYLDRFYDTGLYDESVYPPLETVPKRYAISKRNKWMIDQSDVVVSYVLHSFGGAASSLRYAKRKNKNIIYLGRESFV